MSKPTNVIQQRAMPAGKYWIGDLCYVMHEEWEEVCSLLFAGRTDHGCNEGVFTLKDGRTFAMFSTAWGDGTYHDTDGREYGVDSGSLGCILLSDIRDHVENHVDCGHSHDLNVFSPCREGGQIMFDDVMIDTDPEEEPNEWDLSDTDE